MSDKVVTTDYGRVDLRFSRCAGIGSAYAVALVFNKSIIREYCNNVPVEATKLFLHSNNAEKQFIVYKERLFNITDYINRMIANQHKRNCHICGIRFKPIKASDKKCYNCFLMEET